MLWRVACHQQDVLDFDRPILEHHSGPFPTTLLVYRTLAVVLESTSRAHGSLLNRFHGQQLPSAWAGAVLAKETRVAPRLWLPTAGLTPARLQLCVSPSTPLGKGEGANWSLHLADFL